MYTNLLVATDGSKHSGKAVIHAIDLAKRLGAKLTFFHAAPEYPDPIYTEGVMMEMMSRKTYVSSAAASSNAILDRAARKAGDAGCPLRGAPRAQPRSVGSDPCGREEIQVRCDRYGIAGAHRIDRSAHRQRDPEGARAHQAAGDRRPLSAAVRPAATDARVVYRFATKCIRTA